MTIPESLSARRARLLLQLSEQERDLAITTARLQEVDALIADIEAAEEVAPTPALEKRERRDLRKLVLELIAGSMGGVPPTTRDIRDHFGFIPSRVRPILDALRDSGKITGDDNGWRLVRGEGDAVRVTAPLQQAAE